MRGKVVISFLAVVAASLLFYYLGQILFSSNFVIAVGFALFLGFITWTGIEKLLAKHSNRRDDSDLFPLLKRDALENWGKKCGEQYRNLNFSLGFVGKKSAKIGYIFNPTRIISIG